MKDLHERELVFYVLPYIRTDKRVRIRGIEFRSSLDLDDLPSTIRVPLQSLCAMFFLGTHAQIVEMTCGFIFVPHNVKEREGLLRQLHEAQLLIAFLYTGPHPSGGVFLSSEHNSIFIFRVKEVSPLLVWPGQSDDRVKLSADFVKLPQAMIPGFEGTRDGRAWLWVTAGSRVYPEIPNVTLNVSQFLADDLWKLLHWEYHWSLQNLYFSEEKFEQLPGTKERLFTSLEWYVRSCRETIGEDESIIYLCTGLEALLRVSEDERSTERFKDAVTTLVGPIPRLDWWLGQFYAARSNAVHAGVLNAMAFFADADAAKRHRSSPQKHSIKAPEQLTPLRPLIYYGRRVFRICFTTIASSATHVHMLNFPREFVHNDERLREICKRLEQKSAPPLRAPQ